MEPQDNKPTETSPPQPAAPIPAPISPEETTAAPQPASPAQSTSKRPSKQMLVIGVVAAVIVLGLIFVLFVL